MSGLSYEIIALIKMLTIWVFLQAPFFIILPIAFLLLEMQFDNLKIVYLSFLIFTNGFMMLADQILVPIAVPIDWSQMVYNLSLIHI